MKIIILSDFACMNGGNVKIAMMTAIGLAKKNYDVTLFTGAGPVESILKNVPNLKIICLNQYDIAADPNRLRAMINGLWNFKARKVFKNLLGNFDKKDTIIHVHSCSKILSTSCIQIANKLGFKVIYHLHEYGIACPNLGFYNYKKEKICTLKPLSMKCIMTNCDSRCYIYKLWRVVRQWVQKNIGGVPQNINYIYISKFSYNILAPFFNKNNKLYYLSNPINVKKEKRIKVENNKDFIFIGRLVPEKSPVLLAKVASEMDLPIIFIGSGPCEKEIKEVYPQAKITGWVNKNRIENLLEKARCLVFPSNWYECQPLVVLECLAKGIPCISSKNCASSESLISGKTGLLFENNNPSDLKNKIKMFQDDFFIKYLSENAYNNYWSNKYYRVDNYIIRLLEIYKDVLS